MRAVIDGPGGRLWGIVATRCPGLNPVSTYARPASPVGPHPLVVVFLFEKHTSGPRKLVHSFDYVALAALELSV